MTLNYTANILLWNSYHNIAPKIPQAQPLTMILFLRSISEKWNFIHTYIRAWTYKAICISKIINIKLSMHNHENPCGTLNYFHFHIQAGKNTTKQPINQEYFPEKSDLMILKTFVTSAQIWKKTSTG